MNKLFFLMVCIVVAPLSQSSRARTREGGPLRVSRGLQERSQKQCSASALETFSQIATAEASPKLSPDIACDPALKSSLHHETIKAVNKVAKDLRPDDPGLVVEIPCPADLHAALGFSGSPLNQSLAGSVVMSEAGKTERQQQDEASASATPVSKHTRKGHRPSLLDIEAMEDISDIRPSKNEWTSEECVRILQPFMKLPPAKWPVASERIRFFEMAAVPSDATTAVRDFVVEREPPSEPGPLQAYNEKYRDCSCLLRSHETLYPLEVAEQLRPLADKRVQDWSKAEIHVAVALLKGAPSVDFAKKQGVATVKDGEDVWTRFVDKWEVFLAENPRVKREVDPFLVIIDVFGATPAMVADVNAARAAYPPGGRGPSSPLPPLSASLNGRDFIFPFQDRQHAQHFIGWMQGRIGGLRCWLTRGSLAVNPDYV